jgi:hypothetical protein
VTKTESNDDEIMPAWWLDGLTKDQKKRIELLLEEIMAAGYPESRQSIRDIMKRALDKEIMFARVRVPKFGHCSPEHADQAGST